MLSHDITELDLEMLRAWPLPMPEGEGDKETRGRLLIVGGSREIGGAVLLAATAALRAGAGKVTVATVESIAPSLAIALPEARIVSLPLTQAGGIGAEASALLDTSVARADAVLIGPGMQDEKGTCALVRTLLPALSGKQVILDANAMGIVRPGKASPGLHAGQVSSHFAEGSDLPSDETMRRDPTDDADRADDKSFRFPEPVLLTPHAGEMAHLTGMHKEAVQNAPAAAAEDWARRWNAIVALKGATTHIADPSGRLWRHAHGNIGLAASGSGDVLAGLIGGLAARGATLTQACAWGVALHAAAGELLAKRIGLIGYLAREIPAEIPGLMAKHGPDDALPFF